MGGRKPTNREFQEEQEFHAFILDFLNTIKSLEAFEERDKFIAESIESVTNERNLEYILSQIPTIGLLGNETAKILIFIGERDVLIDNLDCFTGLSSSISKELRIDEEDKKRLQDYNLIFGDPKTEEDEEIIDSPTKFIDENGAGVMLIGKLHSATNKRGREMAGRLIISNIDVFPDPYQIITLLVEENLYKFIFSNKAHFFHTTELNRRRIAEIIIAEGEAHPERIKYLCGKLILFEKKELGKTVALAILKWGTQKDVMRFDDYFDRFHGLDMEIAKLLIDRDLSHKVIDNWSIFIDMDYGECLNHMISQGPSAAMQILIRVKQIPRQYLTDELAKNLLAMGLADVFFYRGRPSYFQLNPETEKEYNI